MSTLYQKIRLKLNRRKVKVFSIFVLLSLVFWFISNLAETYQGTATFKIRFKNVPEILFFQKEVTPLVTARIEASGFQFLRYNFFKKDIVIDIADLKTNTVTYALEAPAVQAQFEEQLPQTVKVKYVNGNKAIPVPVYKAVVKKVPVQLQSTIQLAPNHIIDGAISIVPDSVLVIGPKQEIDSIDVIHTKPLDLGNVSESIATTLELVKSATLVNTKYSLAAVDVALSVTKFSEQLIEVPVQVVNIPSGTYIKTFPSSVSVLCRGSVEALKKLRPDDFTLVADYREVEEQGSFLLGLELRQKPAFLIDALLLEQNVEFILKRE